MVAFARLRDFTCTADWLICGGIGQGAANALAANGIEAVGAGALQEGPRFEPPSGLLLLRTSSASHYRPDAVGRQLPAGTDSLANVGDSQNRDRELVFRNQPVRRGI
jgi:hypothetical protein